MDFFRDSRWCLAYMGHHFDDPSKDWSKPMHWFVFLIAVTADFWMLWFTIDAIEDLPLATASLSVTLTNMLTLSKWATILRKKESFGNQIKQLNELNEKFQKLDKKRRLFTAHEVTSRFLHRYRQLCLLTGFYFCLMPFAQMIYQAVSNEPISFVLPFPMKVPFIDPYQDLTAYIIVFVYTTVITWFICFYVPAIDCLFYSFAINVSTHFRILQDIIKANEFKGTPREMQETIAALAKHHNFLLDFSEKMRVLFEPVIIFQFFFSSLQVCLIVFQIVTNTTNFVVLIPNITFIIVILSQLLIYCYGGEIITHESLQINWAIQTSQWYNLPPQLHGPLGLIMQRAQKPVVIEAGFYKATLESFMNIVQTAASYITLMQSLD